MTTTALLERADPRTDVPSRSSIDDQLLALRGKRVAIAMSGGVDSSVAALRLVAAGALPIGLSLRLHDADPLEPLASRACCAAEDIQDGRRVAEVLGFPFYAIDAREAFDRDVVVPFVRSYLEGRTPNPCVRCNSFVKLGWLVRRARLLGCDAIVTGHYARSAVDEAGDPHLYAGADAAKDQSYFLFGVERGILVSLVFPLGAMTKAEVRSAAIEARLPVAHKLDSQEVCFVGGSGAGAYVLSRPEAGGDRFGPVTDESGRVIGRHEGVARFTIGQRKNLGLGTHHRLHVLEIDAETRTVVVGHEERLMRSGLVAVDAVWTAGVPAAELRVVAKIRYRDPGTPALLRTYGTRVELHFSHPVRAIAPGQAVVFYRGSEVLGGAWIERAI